MAKRHATLGPLKPRIAQQYIANYANQAWTSTGKAQEEAIANLAILAIMFEAARYGETPNVTWERLREMVKNDAGRRVDRRGSRSISAAGRS